MTCLRELSNVVREPACVETGQHRVLPVGHSGEYRVTSVGFLPGNPNLSIPERSTKPAQVERQHRQGKAHSPQHGEHMKMGEKPPARGGYSDIIPRGSIPGDILGPRERAIAEGSV